MPTGLSANHRSCLAGLILFVAGCGEIEPVQLHEQGKETVRQFDQAHKSAARALSVGNSEALLDAESPYIEAITCRLSIEALDDRLTESNVLTTEQKAELDRVKELYERRIQQFAAERGTVGPAIDQDRAQVAIQLDDASTKLQTAVGCLRKLT